MVHGALSGILGNDYVLHPIDQYPIKIDSDYSMDDTWLMNLSFLFRIKSLDIKYEMNNFY